MCLTSVSYSQVPQKKAVCSATRSAQLTKTGKLGDHQGLNTTIVYEKWFIKHRRGGELSQSRLCFALRSGQPECLTLRFLTLLNGATEVSVTCTEVTGLCLIQLALERQSVIFISILASLALKTSGTSTAMHLVSIIYLFISASRFGPGCCLN